MTTQSQRTSFFALTEDDQADGAVEVERIEIPLFQRDYAQGRESDPVRRIRTDFLDVLRAAVAGDEQAAVGLDFVYGGVEEGTLRPLDGQQRLTTLFLLHWYIASRSGNLGEDHGWKSFSYATRQSARMFCESLVIHPLPDSVQPSGWIKDQSWYLFLWRHDPTIQSALVMLDGIHDRFSDLDPVSAWRRLTDVDNPAIWFLLLPLTGLGSADGADMRAEDLYLKMNSRGKPLTEFENFKAHFEKTIQWSPRASDFALKVDTDWSDMLWAVRGEDDLIDDEFLRYLEFITEICEWRDGCTGGAGRRLGQRTAAVFGVTSPQRDAHLDFLFEAFDIWVKCSIATTFDSLFTSAPDIDDDEMGVRLFFRSDGSKQPESNLFEACCRSYGESRGRTRVFSLGQALVLYAVVLHLTEGTDDFLRRLRVLRNLIEASSDELRPDKMPEIIVDVHRVIRDGQIEGVATLNQAQVADEKLKAAFLNDNSRLRSELFRLEDHELLRGTLGAFEFDPATFESRGSAFRQLMARPDLWPELLAALLAVGEYQRRRAHGRPFLFGTDSKKHDSAWRNLLTGATREALRPTRATLAAFLDRVWSHPGTLAEAMTAITTEYLARCEAEQHFDWRYYMVKYPAMRENGSSTYFDSEHLAMSYSLCMLKAGGRALNGYYRDPYLLAIARELEQPEVVEDKSFAGSAEHPRRLPLIQSGAAIRCVAEGFEMSPPSTETHAQAFSAACAELGADTDLLSRSYAEVPTTLTCRHAAAHRRHAPSKSPSTTKSWRQEPAALTASCFSTSPSATWSCRRRALRGT